MGKISKTVRWGQKKGGTLMTKTEKRFLAILLTAVGVMIAAGTAVVLLTMYRLIWSNPFGEKLINGLQQVQSCWIQDGASMDSTSWELPLPMYRFTPGPEWTQTQNAQDTANRMSWEYQDTYQNQQGDTLTFSQEIAIEGEYQFAQRMEMEGDTHLFFYQGPSDIWAEDTVTRIFWIHEGSLLTITRSGLVSDQEMLELFRQADYDTLRQPNARPFTLHQEIEEETDENGILLTYRHYFLEGNPEVPPDGTFCALPSPPTGYTLDDSQWLQPQFVAADQLTQFYRCYPNRLLQYDCWMGIQGPFSLLFVPEGTEVQEVSVKGNPGLICSSSGQWSIIWWDQYRVMQFSSSQFLTPEVLLQLAEQVEPIQEME